MKHKVAALRLSAIISLAVMQHMHSAAFYAIWHNHYLGQMTLLREDCQPVNDRCTCQCIWVVSHQGYYRRGEANFALGRHKNALKDFKSAARLAPKDPDCRRKLAACEKEVKRIRFEEALATPVSFLPPVSLMCVVEFCSC